MGHPEADPVLELSALEGMRQAIEDLDSRAGSLYDYLDKGHPDEDGKMRAFETISGYESLSRNLTGQYVAHLTRLRRDRPELVSRWTSEHIARLAGLAGRIDGLASSASEASMLLYVIESLKSRWRGVLEGDDSPVSEHPALRDPIDPGPGGD
jgi:hypothetical protein